MFESYWQQLEGSNNGEVNAITAAAFLKKSQLKESTLHKVNKLGIVISDHLIAIPIRYGISQILAVRVILINRLVKQVFNPSDSESISSHSSQ